MLLSPKATHCPQKRQHELHKHGVQQSEALSCCSHCKHSSQQKEAKNPPQFAVANDFLIGDANERIETLSGPESAFTSSNWNTSHVFCLCADSIVK